MTRIKDVKASTIGIVNELILEQINDAGSSEHKIKIVTNFGIVEGMLLLRSEKNDLENNAGDLIRKAVEIRNEKLTDPSKTRNDGSFLVLQNAIVKPFANPHEIQEFDTLALFSDQIAGFSIDNQNK